MSTAIAEKTIQICCVAPKLFNPEGFRIRRSYNWAELFIPGCSEGEEYTSLRIKDHIDWQVHHVEYDASKAIRTEVKIPAEVIVSDFFSTELLAQKGCFIPAGDVPTSSEIAQAHAMRKAYLVRLVQEGDIEWSRSGSVINISGEAKRAVEELGIENDWAKLAPKSTIECPACFTKINPRAAICSACGAIIDRKRALEFGLIEEVEAKRGPGRPKKEVEAEAT